MKWKRKNNVQFEIWSWCEDIEEDALKQAINLGNHPSVYHHVALMPDCHFGFGMPIGGVVGLNSSVIPNAVGVDIGCGMGAIRTNFPAGDFTEKKLIRELLEFIKKRVPVGEGNSRTERIEWDGFEKYLNTTGFGTTKPDFKNPDLPPWITEHGWALDGENLGSLGGGNHFIELQKGDDGFIWLMLHSGSRNLGHRIASFYAKKAIDINEKEGIQLPDKQLAFLHADSPEGQAYIRDMNYALEYARENRRIMMDVFKQAVMIYMPGVEFTMEVNIHHNYAALEDHFGQKVWVHRKGATSAKTGEIGIIPGSMGTSSYIVEGLGNPDSFMSCSHGAGRSYGRMEASRRFTVEEADRAMEGIVFDRWKRMKGHKKNKKEGLLMDLGEVPQAYKDIDQVIESELDLIKPIVRLRPVGVIKG